MSGQDVEDVLFAEPDTIPLPERFASRQVRVVVPADVAFDLDRIQKVTGTVLEPAPCPDPHLAIERRWPPILAR